MLDDVLELLLQGLLEGTAERLPSWIWKLIGLLAVGAVVTGYLLFGR